MTRDTVVSPVEVRIRAPQMRQDVVVRARLYEMLDRGLQCRFTLVSAPAGFGKSTLLASWLADRGLASAWISLDSVDNDRVRFARRLREAFRTLAPGSKSDKDDSIASQVDLTVLTEGLLGGLRDRTEPAVLVFDDYHLVDLAAIHDAVVFLLSHLPPSLHLVLVTRADPPFPLGRLRASGDFVEVRAEDLRFAGDEAREFVRKSSPSEIDDDDLAVLVRRTEGWAAGLKLAMLSLERGRDVHAFVREFSGTNRFVLDYLVEEVLARQPHDITTFLLETSVLGTLTADACAAVTDRDDCQRILEQLERANLFTVGLDDERRSYRYHHLFAELLRARLRQLHPGTESSLRLRACEWYEQRGMADEAIRQAIEMHDTERALALLERWWSRYVLLGEFDGFRRWLDALPRADVDRHPVLCAARAWIPIVQGHVEDIRGAVRDVEAALARDDPYGDPAVRSTIAAQLALMRGAAALLLDHDPEAAVARSLEARRVLPTDLPQSLRTIFDGMVPLQIGHARQVQGALAEAASSYREALPHLWASDNTLGVAEATMYLAQVEERLGHRETALQVCEETLAHAERVGLGNAPALAGIYMARAEIHERCGDASSAEREATDALGRARLVGSVRMVAEAQRILSRLKEPGDRTREVPGLIEPLTPREQEILALLAVGRSNRQIAEELVVALGTVKAHVHAICAKLGASSRLDAVARGRAHGLLM